MKWTYISALFFLSPAFAIAADGSSSSGDMLEVGRNGTVDVQVNGLPAKMEFRGDGISYPVLNPDVAEKYKLRSNFFANVLGIEAKVGPITIPGRTGKAKFSIEGQDGSRRMLWFDRPIAPGLDGSVGPNAVPQSRIRLNVGADTAHPTQASLPLRVEDGRVGTTIRIDQTDVFVMFNPMSPRTIASAGAGQVIAIAQAGKWGGAQESAIVNFGIERPVRNLVLSSPIQIGNVTVANLLVRDNSRLVGVDEIKNQAEGDDANEVTLPAVTVTAKQGGLKPSYKLTLGKDVLSRCASITFNKVLGQIDLNCDQGGS